MKLAHISSKANTLQRTQLKLPQTGAFSRITKEDKKLLHKCLQIYRPLSQYYEDSWGYIIQATRYGGFKWYDPHNNSLIFFGRKSRSGHTLVVLNYFAKIEYLVKVLNQIKLIQRTPRVILKNIDPKNIDMYKNFNFFPYGENDRWDEVSRYDDQTFPQLIIDLQALTDCKGQKYWKLRNLLNKKLQLSIRPYMDKDKNAVLNILSMKDGHADKNRMYYESHKMYPTADLGKSVIIDERTNEIVGFTATSDISKDTSALVAALFKPGSKLTSVWGIYQTLTLKYKEGIHYMNLGGNETSGSFNFMSEKFRPVKQIERTHLIYTPLNS